jgi:hypothetical protein
MKAKVVRIAHYYQDHTLNNRENTPNNREYLLNNSEYSLNNSEYTLNNSEYTLNNSEYSLNNSHLSPKWKSPHELRALSVNSCVLTSHRVSALTSKYFHHLVGVLCDVDFVKNVLDLSLFVDQKSLARNAHVAFTHKLFRTVNAVKIADGMIGVGDQGHRQIVFRFKFLVLFLRVGRNAQRRNS